MAVRLNNSMVDELKRSFRLRDYDNDGQIFSRDVGHVIRSVKGLKPSEGEVKAIMVDIDNIGGEVNIETLVQLITKYVTNPEPDQPKELAEMFRMYDKDGRGYISIQDMRHVLTNVGEKLTNHEAEELLKMSGCVEQGRVNYQRFVQEIMTD